MIIGIIYLRPFMKWLIKEYHVLPDFGITKNDVDSIIEDYIKFQFGNKK